MNTEIGKHGLTHNPGLENGRPSHNWAQTKNEPFAYNTNTDNYRTQQLKF